MNFIYKLELESWKKTIKKSEGYIEYLKKNIFPYKLKFPALISGMENNIISINSLINLLKQKLELFASNHDAKLKHEITIYIKMLKNITSKTIKSDKKIAQLISQLNITR